MTKTRRSKEAYTGLPAFEVEVLQHKTEIALHTESFLNDYKSARANFRIESMHSLHSNSVTYKLFSDGLR